MGESYDLSKANVLPTLPSRYQHDEGDSLPDGLLGATIVRIGGVDAPQVVEGGGLVIDYRKAGCDEVTRVVLAFNELGMWVEAKKVQDKQYGSVLDVLRPEVVVEMMNEMRTTAKKGSP